VGLRLKSRAVLFGGSGFIGSAIRARLGADVVAPPRKEVDLRDRDALHRAIPEGSVVINAAGWAAATDRSPGSLRRLRSDNVEGPLRLAEACVAAGASHLVHVSSVAAMGHTSGVDLTETSMVPPDSPYGRSKLAAERLLRDVTSGPPITILRPTSVFGEGRGLAMSLCRMASLPLVPLPNGGRALIPFTHVDNVAHAVALSIGNPRCFDRTLIVGDWSSYSLREIVEGLARAMGKSPRLVPIPAATIRAAGRLESVLARARRRPPLLDSQRLRTLTESVSYSIRELQLATGYEPIVPFDEALERIGRWYRSGRSK
jgi:UDP-glucose 4-epimerase